jgi:DNA segregation ATPase FtsK/SpoIIIE-like protein
VVDEAYDLLASSPDLTKAETAQRSEAFRHLRALAAKGAGAGVSVIVATQQPYANVVLGSLRENLEARLLLGHARADQSHMVVDSDDGERVAPDAPRGRALARLGGYVDVQVAWLDARDVDRWLPARRLHAVADSA